MIIAALPEQFAVMRPERIKTWSQALWVDMHNARKMKCGNVEEGPAPVVLIGSDDALADLRAAHDHFNPKRKKGGSVGLEFIFSGSRETFADPATRFDRAMQLTDLAIGYLQDRFGRDGQVVHVVLHLDEITPHIHAIVIPVTLEADKRTAKREYYRDADGKQRWRKAEGAQAGKASWRLSSDKAMGNRAQLAIEQTEWAKRCAPLGLVRGRESSKDRHIPARERETMLHHATKQAQREAAMYAQENAAVKVEREGLERSRKMLATDRAEVDNLRMELEKKRLELETSIRRARAEESRLAGLRNGLDAERAAFEEKIAKARKWKAGLDAQRNRVVEERDRLAKDAPAVAHLAETAIKALRSIDLKCIPDHERSVVMQAAYVIGHRLETAGDAHWSIAAARNELRSTSHSRGR